MRQTRQTGDPLLVALGVPRPERVADELAIRELVRLERLWRDVGEWDNVAECFTDEAVIRTTWFEGNAKEFALQSKVMAEHGRHSKHPIDPIYVLIDGERALVESRAQIQNRSELDGVWFDMTQYVRFFSRVRRTEAGWRLASFEGIYEKGTIAPVNPDDSLPFDWAEVESSTTRTSYRLWAWSMSRRGYTVPDDRLGDDDPDGVQRFYAAERAWLGGRS
ncbi:nuclear transport factor 2 family protein [Subtercola sp. YIM 133946]|uniref:nuclear transport factor 2 family protein n=1 Tax=Subtercola sp. YIM 133946 TaxID=3118909 RepID=UPI002F958627